MGVRPSPSGRVETSPVHPEDETGGERWPSGLRQAPAKRLVPLSGLPGSNPGLSVFFPKGKMESRCNIGTVYCSILHFQ